MPSRAAALTEWRGLCAAKEIEVAGELSLVRICMTAVSTSLNFFVLKVSDQKISASVSGRFFGVAQASTAWNGK
jgi:hypothetical protein